MLGNGCGHVNEFGLGGIDLLLLLQSKYRDLGKDTDITVSM